MPKRKPGTLDSDQFSFPGAPDCVQYKAYTLSPLHIDLQVVDFQRCKQVPSMSDTSEIAACPPSLLLMILQLSHLPSPPIGNSSCLFT